MGLVRLKYVSTWRDAYGHTRARFRFRGQSRMLPPPDDPAFWPAYQQAVADFVREEATPAGRETVDWLLRAYQDSPEFKRLAPRTREDYGAMISRIAALVGDKRYRGMTRAGIIKHVRDPLADTPRRADYAVAVLSAVCRWAVLRDLLPTNPCQGVPKLHEKGEGFRPWTEGELATFLEHCTDWEWLVFCLAFYLDQRAGDLVKLTWFQFDGERFTLRQAKTKKPLVIEAHPVLRETLARLPRTEGTILHNARGDPLTRPQLSGRWGDAMKRMKLKGCTLHGLRATNQSVLADAGATTEQRMAVSGHKSRAMADHYARGSSQRRLAASAVAMLPTMRRPKG